MNQQLDDVFFDMALECQNNMGSFEKLIEHLNQNKKVKNEIDLHQLQDQSEQLENFVSNNRIINHNKLSNEQQTDIIEIKLMVTAIPIRIFLGQIPKNWTENDLKIFFQKHSCINKIEVLKDTKAQHLGCAFIHFSSLNEAERVMEIYSNQHFPNNKAKINMKWAVGEDERLGTCENSAHKLIVKNVPALISDKSLINIFQNFGKLDELKVIRDPSTQQCKGHAFIKYVRNESAHLAYQNINKQKIFLAEDMALKVSFTEKSFHKKKKALDKHLKKFREDVKNKHIFRDLIPDSIPYAKYYYQYFIDQDSIPIFYHPLSNKVSYQKPPPSSLVWQPDNSCIIIPKVFPCHIDFGPKKERISYFQQQVVVPGPLYANLFIFHLPKTYTERNLYELFAGYGQIISVSVCRKPNGDSKGYGFVSFSTPQEAADAIQGLNGILIQDKRIKVELKQIEKERKTKVNALLKEGTLDLLIK